jgi:RNA polymerase sigma factor for flagellar operon FliA
VKKNMDDNEKILWERYLRDRSQEDRKEIVKYYINLVRYVVEKVYRQTSLNSKDDLFNIGIMGLITAVEKFDPYRGIKFITYAYFRVYGSIMDHIRDSEWMPRSVREKSLKLENAIRHLAEKGVENPCDEDIAAEMGMSIEDYHRFQEGLRVNRIYSINDFFSESGEDNINTLQMEIDDEEKKIMIATAIDKVLDERERTVISLYYYEGLSFKEVAEVMRFTEARISQIHASAIMKIRTYLLKETKIKV